MSKMKMVDHVQILKAANTLEKFGYDHTARILRKIVFPEPIETTLRAGTLHE